MSTVIFVIQYFYKYFFLRENIMFVEESIIIDAALQKVWDTFTDLACWADWNTVMKDVAFGTPRMEEGTSFKCTLRPFFFPIHVEPKIEVIVPREKIVWTGEKHGVTSRHEFIFSETSEGVNVTSKEEFDGSPEGTIAMLLTSTKVSELTRKLLHELREEAEF